jgi:undecaprenyl-diphosphatase
MRQTLLGLIAFLGSHVNLVLAAILIVVGGTWGFVELLDEVQEGDTRKIDEWTMRTVTRWHGERWRWLEEIGRDITALGGTAVLTICTLSVAGFLAMVRKYHAMWLVIIATAGGLALSHLLKWLIERPRPRLSEHLSHVYTSSFPSGHSMMSAVVYLTLGTLLARVVARRTLKLYFIVIALFLTFIVGVSRVYMGVHWPTDVLAGWTAGLVWAILCWLVARRLQRRGAIESDAEQPDDQQ